MKWLKTPLSICGQNFRRWRGNYKIYVVFVFLIAICNLCDDNYLYFSKLLEDNPGVPIWTAVFAVDFNYDNRILIFSLLVMLFSNAPFIDDNQLFVISRCSRQKRCVGQLLYIYATSGIFVIAFVLIFNILHFWSIDFTSDWGRMIIVAANGQNPESVICMINSDIVDYFTPAVAMFYTMLLMWLGCIFIGLVIYVVNSATQKLAFGVLSGGFFVLWDCFSEAIARTASEEKKIIFDYLSPVSWSSLSRLDFTGEHIHPGITYVLVAYAVLIIGLSAAAVLISKRQEIKVIQAV